MLLIPKMLTSSELADVIARVERMPTVAGSESADGPARDVKNNRELPLDGPDATAIGDVVLAALRRHSRFQAFALPHKIRMPIVSLYEPGMAYGDHVDAPVMGAGPIHATRTDLSVTVFLSDPDSYDGGELMLRTPIGDRPVKLPAGGAVCYSTEHIHRVEPVTRGSRLAAVTWMQSRIRDHGHRAVLFDLAQSMAELPEDTPETLRLRLRHVYARLVQGWTEV